MEYAMNSLDIDLLDGEVVHRNDPDAQKPPFADRRSREAWL
jgi:hypothetical protein